MKYLFVSIIFIGFVSCDSEENEVVPAKKLGEEVEITDSISEKTEYLEKDTIILKGVSQTNNGLNYVVYKQGKKGKIIKEGNVIRLTYSLLSPSGEMLKSSESAGDNYAIVQGASFVPEVLDKALLGFKQGDEIKLKVPALHPKMEQFKPGLFDVEDTLTYDLKIKEIIDSQKLEKGVELFLVHEGSGTKITPGDKIGVDFFGFLSNGEAFISSRQISPEFECIVGQECIVPGLDVAFQNMHVDDKAYVKVPADMAYGKKGHASVVPANSDLIYFVTIDYSK